MVGITDPDVSPSASGLSIVGWPALLGATAGLFFAGVGLGVAASCLIMARKVSYSDAQQCTCFFVPTAYD